MPLQLKGSARCTVMGSITWLCAACHVAISDVEQTERLVKCGLIAPSDAYSSREDESEGVSESGALRLFDREEVIVVAHRGYAKRHPENTIVAIERAFELGADVVEVDVHITRDGVPVIMHDLTVDRTTNGTGRVVDLDFAQIAKLDACSWFGDRWQPCNVPTLLEALAAARKHDGILLLDLKPPIGSAGIISIIHNVYCAEMSAHTIIMSFDLGVAHRISQLAPSIPVGLATQQARDPRDLEVAGLRFAAVNKTALQQDPLYPSVLANYNLATMSWTITKRFEAEFLISTGVQFLITDIPLTKDDLTIDPANWPTTNGTVD